MPNHNFAVYKQSVKLVRSISKRLFKKWTSSMLSRQHRLTDSDDFQQVFQKGKSFANRNYVLYHWLRSTEGHFRLGLSVSKKIGNAVVRNRVRRLLREAFRDVIAENSLELPAVDLVLIARIPAAELEFTEVKQNIKHLLERTGYLSKESGRQTKGSAAEPV